MPEIPFAETLERRQPIERQVQFRSVTLRTQAIDAVRERLQEADVLSTNLRFSMLRTANSGLFIVYNEFDERGPGALPVGREFIIKYSYLFDVFD